MSAQKIPLFNGLIVPAANSATTAIFTPPDSGSDAPSIYEVTLYVLPRGPDGGVTPLRTLIRATEGGGPPAGVVWDARTVVGVDKDPVVKALDGYPVRGDVKLEMIISGGLVVPGDPIFMWGYYQRAGQGDLTQPARRPIGQSLSAFSAGVPFELLPAADAVVHVFEKNRIDEMTLALFFSDNPAAAADQIEVTFENESNGVIGAAVPFRPRTSISYSAFASGRAVPPQGSFLPPSPYIIYQCPFGGGGSPTLHHLRVKNASGLGVSVHGYFTRS